MVKKEYKLDDKIQIIQWCAYDPKFTPNTRDRRFKSWISQGITTFYSLTERRQLKSFENVKNQFNLDRTDFYRYLQIRHHFDHNIKNKTDFDDPILRIFLCAYENNIDKGIISSLYNGFMTKKRHNTEYIKEKWETEGNLSISNEDWSEICEFQ